MTAPALCAENLSLAYREVKLFSGVYLQLNPGEWLLLRGANGSGKTSLLKLLAGLIRRPGDARIDWGASPLAEAAAEGGLIGWVGHSPGLIEPLSALENLQLDPGLDLHSAMDALQGAGLGEVADLPVHRLSEGQRRRAALLRLSLENARLWLLDEPLTALDVQARGWFVGLLGQHLQDGGCAVIASHAPLGIEPDAEIDLSASE